ncbi:MAG: acyl-phosphate glycerol 3-phosphate acyltransferase [Ignavibacteria bacterium]|nr:MAG: acyl-phosphate glycerol 3-phosphate acyltransferase [Ignavibacteria bacterium]KAF0162405.1 MAG: acyl-phosphate glycerol 3-phosphate acyltransferase [Ignavibacteria bacterium]
MNYIFSALFGYLIGSLPTAYLLLKKTHGIDITQNGSGNVGAMNSFNVSKSKRIGLYVFLIDAAKGFLSSIIAYYLVEESFIIAITSLTASVFSHCYSPWIKFKGGRGLATAAGGAFFISLPVLAVWAVNWTAIYLFSKSIYLGNFMATLFTAISAFVLAQMLIMYSFLKPYSIEQFSYAVSILMLIILSKHIIPMRDYIRAPLKTFVLKYFIPQSGTKEIDIFRGDNKNI